MKEPRGVLVEFNRYEIEHDSFGGFIPVRCWVTDDFKLVLNLFTSDELYDRRNDPNEMHNLIDDIHFADVRSKMHDAYWITWTKFAIRSAVINGTCVRGAKMHNRAGWGRFVHAHRMVILQWYATMTPVYRHKG